MTTEYADALPRGSRIEGYEIVRVLGVGGFGMTYLGFDDGLNAPVAIKEYLPSDLARRDSSQTVTPRSTGDQADFQWGLDGFLSEARKLARFDHPNIIRVRRFFRGHGTAYIVMDYAEGETLADKLSHEGTLNEAQVKEILRPLLYGLEAVHRSELLHRDIKPGNIIIKDNGQPVLIDFGAARQQTGARSRSMRAIATPGYAPPEQYSTKGKQGTWTDIYAMAAVAYRMLTGITPEDSPDRMMDDELVPATQAGKGQASQGFLKVIDQALSLNGQDRPQNVSEFRAALEGIPANYKPVSPQEKNWEEKKSASDQREAKDNLSSLPLAQSGKPFVLEVLAWTSLSFFTPFLFAVMLGMIFNIIGFRQLTLSFIFFNYQLPFIIIFSSVSYAYLMWQGRKELKSKLIFLNSSYILACHFLTWSAILSTDNSIPPGVVLFTFIFWSILFSTMMSSMDLKKQRGAFIALFLSVPIGVYSTWQAIKEKAWKWVLALLFTVIGGANLVFLSWVILRLVIDGR